MQNKRYTELETESHVYIPDVEIDYPDDNPYERLYHPVYDRQVLVDEHYPYLDNRLNFVS